MKKLIALTFTFLIVGMISKLSAQSVEQKKMSSLELITQMFARVTPTNLETSSMFPSRNMAGVFYGENINPEIQVRYVREVVEGISLYGALAYGINYFSSTYVVVTGDIETTFFASDFKSTFPTKKHQIGYGSAHLGVRYALSIKRNDAFNISLGGKGIYYPSKDLSINESSFSTTRMANFTYEFENDEILSHKFLTGLELDLNYQFGFANSPLKLMLGVTVDRVIKPVRELNAQITIDGVATEFRHEFGGGRVGGYLGLSYALRDY